ncbi:MAG: translocation/assembly module TamB domain-containing protein, partial [Ginsengibacter sp.]
QNFAREKVVTYLEHKLKTTVEIGKLDIKFPTAISLQKVFFEDQTKDTLIYGGEIKVDIDMFQLLRNNIQIKEIYLDDILAKVKRLPPDSAFNFQFIVDAFSSEEKKTPEKEDTSTLKMNIERILVKKTRIIYKDLLSGNDMDLAIGQLDTKITTFDPSHMHFNIPSIALQGLKGHFYQLEPLEKPVDKSIAEASSEPDNYLQFENKEISLGDIDVVYKSEPSHINSSFVISHAEVHPKKIDLKNSIVSLKDILLEKSEISIETNSKATNEKPKDTITNVADTSSMKIIADNINLKNVSLKYDDQSAPKIPAGMDFSHLGIENFSTNVANVQYSADTILASVKSLSFEEKSGFVINNFTTDFYMIPTGVFLYNLFIKTPGTELKPRLYATYPSLDAIKKNMGELGLYIDLQQSKIALKDVLTIMPQLKEQLPSISSQSTIYVDAKITGKVSDLNLQKVRIRGLTATDININGTIKGLPDPKKIYADLRINQFQSSRRDLLSLVPKNTLPKNVSLPQAFSAKGYIKGGINNLRTELTLNSTSGGAHFIGTLINITDKNKATYDATLNIRRLQLGVIMQNPKLGPLTADLKVKGKGYNPETANATFNGLVSEATLNDYTYRKLKLGGSIADKIYKINASLHDSNLDATIAANGNFSGNNPTVHLDAKIDSIKTMPLHFTSQPLIYHGTIVADFSNINPDTLNGKLFITHSILVNNGKRIELDSLSLIADHFADSQRIALKSDFFAASINGRYQLTQLGNIFQQAINPYFSLTEKKDTIKTSPYHFTISAGLNNSPTLRAFMPDLTQLKPVTFSGNFDSDSGWNVLMRSPHIVYGTSVIDSLNLSVGTENGILVYNTSLQHLLSGSSFNLYATTLHGQVQNNKIGFSLNIKDQKAKDKYILTGSLNQPTLNKYVFSLNDDSLLLNYKKWTVNTENKIQYFNKDINASNFVLSQGDQQLSIKSESNGANVPLQVNFKNFKIETLTGFVQSDSLMVAGLLNGNATVKNIQTQPTFLADITVSELSVYQDTVGNLTAKVNNEVANTYHAEVALNGRGNDIKINGDYLVDSVNSSFDFLVDIGSFQMRDLEGFTKGGIKDARGNLYGKIALKGSLKQPDINGRIQFNKTAFNVSMLNNVFKIDKEAVAVINNKGIEFDTFTIRDTSNNAIVIDGAVNTPDFFNYTFDLKINARNFQATNSTNRDNKLFYGKMVFSSRLTIKGTPTHPIVDGDLTINDKTDFTVVLPSNDPGVEKREGIVRFVDRSATEEDSLFMMAPYDSLNTSPLAGYDVTVNIKVDKEAIFNVIVDPANGDFLRLKGNAELTGGIDASGKVTMVGSYEIEDGTYNLSFNFLKRKFNIQKGSRIVWTGSPTTAQINVTAIYIANTAPIDLVEGQIEAGQANKNIYKQKLPFEVHLLLQGELLKPEISFDIILPSDKNYNVSNDIISTVDTKLAQMRQETSEMNKQVFALLLLNRFVGEDPFSSSGGSTSAGTFAMQSVSRLLSEQLNKLAENLVQGVDINFDLATTQDYTTGTAQDKTDLNVGVSKRLLNDRLTVSVGSNFELQGPMKTNQQQSNLAGNISISYQLSKDGRYLLRAYRKNDYTGALEGYVVETGVGFVISVDYNKFKEIFIDKEQRRQKRQIIRQNKEIQKGDDAKNESEQTISPPAKANENDK